MKSFCESDAPHFAHIPHAGALIVESANAGSALASLKPPFAESIPCSAAFASVPALPAALSPSSSSPASEELVTGPAAAPEDTGGEFVWAAKVRVAKSEDGFDHRHWDWKPSGYAFQRQIGDPA